jgi:hypothetical protein
MFCDDGTRHAIGGRATWLFSLVSVGEYSSSRQETDCNGQRSTEDSPTMTFEATDSVIVERLEPSQGDYSEWNGICHPP